MPENCDLTASCVATTAEASMKSARNRRCKDTGTAYENPRELRRVK